ncbi:MAG: succinyl-diaminopimelate desuccinylase [Gammaproteobacteria bacterium]|nr:MAG: succinyl-diaminopimelate desuccinylase [Gammaproteobacteria bacterium]
MKTKELLLDLLARPSVTPNDAGCMDVLGDYLRAHGFSVEIVTFGDVKNFWARHGDAAPLTVFAGHTDVVPVGDESTWDSPPFEPTARDGYLFARGAADMKTGVAAMCVAAVEFIETNPDYNGSIAVMLTADEEGPAQDGIKKLMPHLVEQGVQMDYAVFTEPSSVEILGDMIKNGRRGSMHAHLKILGKQGHVAYPENAANPIHALGGIVTALSREVWCDGNDSFPATSKQIWSIDGGVGASNVIPGEANVSFNFRFSTELTSEKIAARVEQLVRQTLDDEHQATGKSYDYQLRYEVSGEPFVTREGALVNAMRDACTEVLGVTPVLSTSGGTSDARFVAPFGVQVVEFGPVNKTIHQVNECVKVADIEPLTLTYQRLLEKLHS